MDDPIDDAAPPPQRPRKRAAAPDPAIPPGATDDPAAPVPPQRARKRAVLPAPAIIAPPPPEAVVPPVPDAVVPPAPAIIAPPPPEAVVPPPPKRTRKRAMLAAEPPVELPPPEPDAPAPAAAGAQPAAARRTPGPPLGAAIDFDPNDPDQLIAAFRARYPFTLDPFQEEAIGHLARGESVMVAAPTGTGKTVVAEFGVFRAWARGWKVMYTTPIKALSNQKFRDLREQYGDAVGLLTGDIIENRDGSILIMTTEVLRNMLLQTPSALWGVGGIIFDEIHYLADPERGTTWEEAIIMCPADIQLVCLSATVTNAPEIAEWIGRTHAAIRLITYTERAVPLSLYYYLDGELHLTVDARGNQVADFPNVGGEVRARGGRRLTTPGEAGDDGGAPRERAEPSAREIVQMLEWRDMLPAIYFLFSRRDCEAAAEICAMMRLRAVQSPAVRREIELVLAKYMARLSPEDRDLEQVKNVVYLGRRGFGFHHAGLLPILKQLVEELFSRALMRVVFATDTLALGINMPARTVVIGRMSKWDGVSRRPLIPNEFQQMAGRAGRRGIDPQGYVIMPYSPWVPFRDGLAIATGPLYPVESAFTVRYNTILNLWDPPRGERMLGLMRRSLLQFQQSRRLRDLEHEVGAWQEQVDAIPEGCLIGLPDGEDLLSEYEALGRSLDAARTRERKLTDSRARQEGRRTELPWRRPEREFTRRLLRTSQPGTVVHLETLGWAVYLGPTGGGPGLFWVGDHVQEVREYHLIDFVPPDRPQVALPPELEDVRMRAAALATELAPGQVLPVAADAQDWMAQQLAGLNLPDLDEWIAQHQATTIAELDAQLGQMDAQIAEAREYTRRIAVEERGHACHTCPVRKQHRTYRRQRGRALAGYDEAVRTLEERRHYEDTRLQTLLDGLVAVLKRFYYLDAQGTPTAKAPRLMDIFDTNALMISELLESGYLAGLLPGDLAEVFSWFAFDRDVEIRNRHLLPGHLVRLRDNLDQLQREIFQTERRHELFISTGYNVFFYGAARAWCRGATMADLLQKMDLSEGDIVMTFNKTLDLMRQVREMIRRQTPDAPLREGLREADALLRRGVVELVYSLGFVPGEQPADVGGHSSGAIVVAPEEAALQQQEAEQLDVIGRLALEGISDEPYDLERVPRPRRDREPPPAPGNRFRPFNRGPGGGGPPQDRPRPPRPPRDGGGGRGPTRRGGPPRRRS